MIITRLGAEIYTKLRMKEREESSFHIELKREKGYSIREVFIRMGEG